MHTGGFEMVKLNEAVRPFMAWYKPIAVFLAVLVPCLAIAAEPSPFDALRTKFPHGVPWKVEILDTNGKPSGTLEMLITSDPGSSCLSDMKDGVRVKFTRKSALPTTMSIASYGVAEITGDEIKIDLTGGICDAYLLMSGKVASDGSSTGDIYTLGMRGGHDVAKYRATVK